MVPFAGFEMPVQYPSGTLQEYHWVRGEDAGLFDISHMGQIRIEGPDALRFLQYATTNDVSRLRPGQVQYSALLNVAGTFIDDITVYRLGEEMFYLCVNAANRVIDIEHLQRLAADFQVRIRDESDATTLLALQGASAQRLLQPLVDMDLEEIAYYHFGTVRLLGHEAIVSRTGYTGEDGFEIYLPDEAAVSIWNALLQAGAHPVGLAARDMLRTEMGYALYGHEISAEVTPVEAGLMWITRLEKGPFLGREAVLERKKSGPERILIALKLNGRGIPREHYPVLADGRICGEVTSGMYSPLAGTGVALAYVLPDAGRADAFAVEIRGRPVAAMRCTTPFVRSRVRRRT